MPAETRSNTRVPIPDIENLDALAKIQTAIQACIQELNLSTASEPPENLAANPLDQPLLLNTVSHPNLPGISGDTLRFHYNLQDIALSRPGDVENLASSFSRAFNASHILILFFDRNPYPSLESNPVIFTENNREIRFADALTGIEALGFAPLPARLPSLATVATNAKYDRALIQQISSLAKNGPLDAELTVRVLLGLYKQWETPDMLKQLQIKLAEKLVASDLSLLEKSIVAQGFDGTTGEIIFTFLSAAGEKLLTLDLRELRAALAINLFNQATNPAAKMHTDRALELVAKSANSSGLFFSGKQSIFEDKITSDFRDDASVRNFLIAGATPVQLENGEMKIEVKTPACPVVEELKINFLERNFLPITHQQLANRLLPRTADPVVTIRPLAGPLPATAPFFLLAGPSRSPTLILPVVFASKRPPDAAKNIFSPFQTLDFGVPQFRPVSRRPTGSHPPPHTKFMLKRPDGQIAPRLNSRHLPHPQSAQTKMRPILVGRTNFYDSIYSASGHIMSVPKPIHHGIAASGRESPRRISQTLESRKPAAGILVGGPAGNAGGRRPDIPRTPGQNRESSFSLLFGSFVKQSRRETFASVTGAVRSNYVRSNHQTTVIGADLARAISAVQRIHNATSHPAHIRNIRNGAYQPSAEVHADRAASIIKATRFTQSSNLLPAANTTKKIFTYPVKIWTQVINLEAGTYESRGIHLPVSQNMQPPLPSRRRFSAKAGGNRRTLDYNVALALALDPAGEKFLPEDQLQTQHYFRNYFLRKRRA